MFLAATAGEPKVLRTVADAAKATAAERARWRGAAGGDADDAGAGAGVAAAGRASVLLGACTRPFRVPGPKLPWRLREIAERIPTSDVSGRIVRRPRPLLRPHPRYFPEPHVTVPTVPDGPSPARTPINTAASGRSGPWRRRARPRPARRSARPHRLRGR